MKTSYRIKGIHFHQEVDNFETGCDPESSSSGYIPYYIEANTPTDCIKDVCAHLNLNENDTELNACDESGRVDIQQLENVDGNEPSQAELDVWKLGKRKLWLKNYSVFIEKITVEIEKL